MVGLATGAAVRDKALNSPVMQQAESVVEVMSEFTAQQEASSFEAALSLIHTKS